MVILTEMSVAGDDESSRDEKGFVPLQFVTNANFPTCFLMLCNPQTLTAIAAED